MRGLGSKSKMALHGNQQQKGLFWMTVLWVLLRRQELDSCFMSMDVVVGSIKL